MEVEDFYVKAADGFELAAKIILTDVALKGVIQFHAGTVVPKEFYLKYAHFLATKGYHVVLFDYRGVGRSKPTNLKGFDASISDWGRLDAPCILTWIRKEYPEVPVHLFAHSMGGQILGLMHNWSSFDKITVVASSSGNWHNFEPSYRRSISWSTRMFFPILLSVKGYVPARFGLGHDWPKGVAIEWSECSKKNMLMADYLLKRVEHAYFDKINKKIIAFFFPDDHMATLMTVPNYQKSYPQASVETKFLIPEDYNLEKIGHFGIFKEWSKGKLWEDVARSLD